MDITDYRQRGIERQLRVVDPLQYPGWDSLISGDRRGSFFHGTAWARVLHESYGHVPAYFCRIADGQLQGLLATAEVSSPLTGRRGVSLPFTDFCAILDPRGQNRASLYDEAVAYGRSRGWRYLECRSNDPEWAGSFPSMTFHGHVVELGGGQDQLFKRLEAAVRRGIRKAERAGLKIEFRDTSESMRSFYALHCLTRRRHGLPPQPFRFFENIARHVIHAGRGLVAVVHLKRGPVAAAVFFHQGRQAYYKFGASDYRFQEFRPNNLLMWAAMTRYAAQGCSSLDLGRTSLANEGLRRFKLSLGAREERIDYFKYNLWRRRFVTDIDRAEGWAKHVFRCFPAGLLRLAGRVLYPHLS
jgi:hypothetical protein